MYAVDVSKTKIWEVKHDLGHKVLRPLKAERISTDNCDHLFVIDSNNACIQMFSADGTYMGAVLHADGVPLRVKEAEMGLVTFQWIRCFGRTSTAAVAYKIGDDNYISVITML